MDPQKAKSIFLHVVEDIARSDWQSYLRDACGDDLSLRHGVELLLAAHEEDVDLADQARVAYDDEVPTIDQPITEQSGSTIGPYKLLQKLGEGGMGVVYMAEQSQPVKRRVALKIIKPGMDTGQVIARFEAERQALALMDHPGIAKVFDAGATESGRPYFVMELVKGVPITQYCDEQQFTPKQRLELFVRACQAVQHAHQKGIIHRDLKPSNVLVAEYDQQAVPKIIDFGVAKATSQQLTEKTVFTQYGQIVGTLEYMSPEQAKLNQLDIDTRSDVYSLGVLLYELLVGATPFDRQRLRSAAFDEMLRIIREEEPPKPSFRLSTIDTLRTVAAHRKTEPRKLNAIVRGELDWIVMKALEKDRSRRYETANGFAADVQRYLNTESVLACPPSSAYRFRKFARRNKAILGTVLMITIALMLGLIGTTWQWRQAEVARDGAEAARENEFEQRQIAQTAQEQERLARLGETQQRREAEQLADQNKELAEEEREARQHAEKQLRIATAMRFAAQSETVRQELFPLRSILLGVEAVEATHRHGEPTVGLAHEALLHAVATVGGRPISSTAVQTTTSSDGRWLLVANADGTSELWDLADSEPSAVRLPLDLREVNVRFISPDGRWLLVAGQPAGLHRQLKLLDLNADGQPTVSIRTHHYAATLLSARQHLVTVDVDGQTVHFWDLTSETPTRSPKVMSATRALSGSENEPIIGTMELSPDGRWLAAAVFRENKPKRHLIDYSWFTVILWDLDAEDGDASAFVLNGPYSSNRYPRLAFSNDGHWFVTGHPDGTVRLWDLVSDDPADTPITLQAHQSFVSGRLLTSPDSRWLVTAGYSSSWSGRRSEVYLWDLQADDPSTSSRLLSGHTAGAHPGAISSDSRWLVTGSNDKTARIWDLASDDPTSSSVALTGHEGTVSILGISPDSRWLVTSSRYVSNTLVFGLSEERRKLDTLRLWDLRAQHRVSSHLSLPSGPTSQSAIHRQLVVTPDSRWLVAGHADNTVRMWELSGRFGSSRCRILQGHQDNVLSFANSTDGQLLVTGSADNTARVWNLSDANAPSLKLAGHTSRVSAVEMSPSGQRVITRSREATRLWDLRKVDSIPAPLVLEGLHERVAVTDRYAITIPYRPRNRDDRNRQVVMWDLHVEDPLSSPTVLGDHNAPVRSLDVTPDGRWLATGSNDKTAQAWDLNAEHPAATRLVFAHPHLVTGVALTPDGRWLATSCDDAAARVWDLQAEDHSAPLHILPGHEDYAWAVAISPDGRWLATAGADRTARVWDLHAEDPAASVRVLRAHELGVTSVAISPDGRWLATKSYDKTIRIWDLDIEFLLARARRLAGRELTSAERQQYFVD